jgi:soluble lytic murein transglycosylase-like protein
VRIDGDTAVLTLRGGGHLECHVDLIRAVAPDEVPYPEPVDIAAETSRTNPAVPVQPRTLVEMAGSASAKASADMSASRPYLTLIETAARRHSVDPRLVHALITVESRYRADARSRKGAMGLMQLMPATARQWQVRDPYDPAANIEAGVRHLRHLLERFDLPEAVAAYNAGAGAVRKFGGVPPFRETQAYVRLVLHLAGAS